MDDTNDKETVRRKIQKALSESDKSPLLSQMLEQKIGHITSDLASFELTVSDFTTLLAATRSVISAGRLHIKQFPDEEFDVRDSWAYKSAVSLEPKISALIGQKSEQQTEPSEEKWKI